MKILLAHNYYQQRGGEDAVFEQELELLRNKGHEVTAYTRHNDELKHWNLIETLQGAPRTLWSLRCKQEFGAVLDQHRPSLVHFHNTFPLMSPSVYAACKERGIAVVQSLHNFRLACPSANFFRKGAPCEKCATTGLWNSVAHGCYRDSRIASATVAAMIAFNRSRGSWRTLVDRFIVCSEFARNKFLQTGLPADQIDIKPNFVSPDPGQRSDKGAYAVYIGRLAAEKGVRTLLSAWRDLRDFPLKIIGDGPLRHELESFAAVNYLDKLDFLGRLPREEAMRHLKSAKYLVFPSECYENFPLSIVEAFACGVPVIASRIGSTAELVRDDVTGRTFTPGDSLDLAQTVLWAERHPRDLMRLGHTARAEYERNYTAKLNYEMLLNTYQSALEHCGSTEILQTSVPLREIA